MVEWWLNIAVAQVLGASKRNVDELGRVREQGYLYRGIVEWLLEHCHSEICSSNLIQVLAWNRLHDSR